MTRHERSLTDAEMKSVPDQDIDFSDIPQADPQFWAQVQVRLPPGPKTPLNLRLDADIVAWFRSRGRGYQTQINAVLRQYFEAHR